MAKFLDMEAAVTVSIASVTAEKKPEKPKKSKDRNKEKKGETK